MASPHSQALPGRKRATRIARTGRPGVVVTQSMAVVVCPCVVRHYRYKGVSLGGYIADCTLGRELSLLYSKENSCSSVHGSYGFVKGVGEG